MIRAFNLVRGNELYPFFLSTRSFILVKEKRALSSAEDKRRLDARLNRPNISR